MNIRPVNILRKKGFDLIVDSSGISKGSHVLEGSQKLYNQGFPMRIVRNFQVERRDAEVHLHEDDLFFIISGSVKFILGGKLTGSIKTDDDLTFTSLDITGGREVVLGAGDWLHIPAGQPHQHITPNMVVLVVVKVAPSEGNVTLPYLKKYTKAGK